TLPVLRNLPTVPTGQGGWHAGSGGSVPTLPPRAGFFTERLSPADKVCGSVKSAIPGSDSPLSRPVAGMFHEPPHGRQSGSPPGHRRVCLRPAERALDRRRASGAGAGLAQGRIAEGATPARRGRGAYGAHRTGRGNRGGLPLPGVGESGVPVVVD